MVYMLTFRQYNNYLFIFKWIQTYSTICILFEWFMIHLLILFIRFFSHNKRRVSIISCLIYILLQTRPYLLKLMLLLMRYYQIRRLSCKLTWKKHDKIWIIKCIWIFKKSSLPELINSIQMRTNLSEVR